MGALERLEDLLEQRSELSRPGHTEMVIIVVVGDAVLGTVACPVAA